VCVALLSRGLLLGPGGQSNPELLRPLNRLDFLPLRVERCEVPLHMCSTQVSRVVGTQPACLGRLACRLPMCALVRSPARLSLSCSAQYTDVFNVVTVDDAGNGRVDSGMLDAVMPRIQASLIGTQKSEGRQVGKCKCK
jgi:hypothetical protein